MVQGAVWVPVLLALAACSAAAGGASPAANPNLDFPAFDVSKVTFPYCPVNEAEIDAVWRRLTPNQRIGQHVMPGAERKAEDGTPTDRTLRVLNEFEVGGVFTYQTNGIVPNKPLVTARFNHVMKRIAFERTGVPLFIACDQEGGTSSVVSSGFGGTDSMGQMPIGAARNPEVAFSQFDILTREIKALGFTMTFAPVLDTLTATANGNLHTRPMGPDPALNAHLGVAEFAAAQKNLVLPMAKHFPGDGMTNGNTHFVLVTNDAPRDVLMRTIVAPFKAAVEAGLDGVMTIPARYPAFDPNRASLTSRAVTTGLLRGELGFKGLVVSDSLDMEGAKIGMAADQIPGVEALKAGADLVLYVLFEPERITALYARIAQELADGTYPAAEFEASTKRILRMKQKYCLFREPTAPDPAAPERITAQIARPEDRERSLENARQSIVLFENPGGVLPLTGKRVLYVGPKKLYGDPGSGWLQLVEMDFGDALRTQDEGVESYTYLLPGDPLNILAEVKAREADFDVIVVGTIQARFSLEQQQMLTYLTAGLETPLVHVVLGVPFDWLYTRGKVAAAVGVMNTRSVQVLAGAEYLYGRIPARGRLLYDMDAVARADEGETGGDGDTEVEAPEGEGGACADARCEPNGTCVTTETTFGCVCRQNFYPSSDRLQCIPVGEPDPTKPSPASR